MRLCTDAITAYHAGHDPNTGMEAWEGVIIDGVSWYADMATQLDDRGLKAAPRVTVRIPEENNPEGYVPRAGDVFVKGICDDLYTSPAKLKHLDGRVTVIGVTDNRRAPNAPHWKVVCT